MLEAGELFGQMLEKGDTASVPRWLIADHQHRETFQRAIECTTAEIIQRLFGVCETMFDQRFAKTVAIELWASVKVRESIDFEVSQYFLLLCNV